MKSEGQKALIAPTAPDTPLRRLLCSNDVLFAIGVATILTTLLIPLPTFALDWLLSCSIALAVATLVVVLSVREAVEFSAFPSLLLCVTLFRLSLNVASTRLILLHGDAGKIIYAFGNFVAGGNLVIGLVVFLILVIIQFVVITKGAERISEVAARFNLDAMPGKQMSIDADLNAGLIGEEEARSRRQKIVKESEFYGAMDGASKFIRGDAIAGLIITGVNLVGGILIGLTRGMTASQAADRFSILAVGDGLVSQIPAVVISTAAGFLISKTSSQSSLSQDLTSQFTSRSRPLGIAAFLLGAMALVPNFPAAPFAVLAVGTGLLSRRLARLERERAASKESARPQAAAEETPVEEMLDVDRVCVQVGPRLIPIVDPRRKTSMAHRIGPLRRKFAQQQGLVLPLIRLRDSVSLDQNCYEIRLHNHVVGGGRLELDKFLAMDPGTVQKPVHGEPAKEPVFNLPALWVEKDMKEQAELNGYTVVDPESVLMTHLSETLRRHAHELLSRDDVQKLLDRLRDSQPALVNGVVPDVAPVGLIHTVLRNLLREGVPIRDLAHILEALGEHAVRTKDPSILTELARKALVRTITELHSDSSGKICAILLAPALEHELRNALRKEGEAETLVIAPEAALELCQRISQSWRAALDQGLDKTVVLCDSRLRRHLAGMLARQLPQLGVVAYDEIAIGAQVQAAGTVSLAVQAGEALPAAR